MLAPETTVLVAKGGGQLKVNAIGDTGATGFATTDKFVKGLGLILTIMAPVLIAGGVIPQNTYTIDIKLPNGVLILGIIATGVPRLSSVNDSLIEMDVIKHGDFSVTTHKGITCISFRTPSSRKLIMLKTQVTK